MLVLWFTCYSTANKAEEGTTIINHHGEIDGHADDKRSLRSFVRERRIAGRRKEGVSKMFARKTCSHSHCQCCFRCWRQ